MANPLDGVTQDMRDDEGRPLRRVVITGEEPVDYNPIFGDISSDNKLQRAVAPEPKTGIMDMIAKVREYLMTTGAGVADQLGVAGVEPGPVRDAAVTGRNSLIGMGDAENQLWPVRMIKSGATLPGDVATGRTPVLPPGLRREDMTDLPLPTAPGYLGEGTQSGGTPYQNLIERAQDTAGLAMPGGLAQKPGTASLGSGPVRQGAVAAETAPVFYSALEHAATNAAQDTMSPQQWAGFLKNQPGVKAEELAWTGIGDWLNQQKGPVKKADVQRYLDEHKVEIQDVAKGGAERLTPAQREELAADYESTYGRGERQPSDAELLEFKYEQYGGDYAETHEGVTKYSDYQLPGGENYREHLLTMPAKPTGKLDANGMPDHSPHYKSSHWDEPNVLAHVRTNERDVGGKPSLHIEEIQSDWHQQGRKQGYRPEQEKKMAELKQQREELLAEANQLAASDPRYKEIYKDLPRIQREINDIGSGGVGVPDAPFKTSWPELALKRMVRLASEEGKDRISWTPGEAQAARYDLSKSLNEVRAWNNKDGTFKVGGKDLQDRIHGFGDNIPKDKLADYVGKDLAEKIAAQDKDTTYSGLDLKVGGEGMREFYDKMLPKMVEKLGKAHGVKVKTAPLGFEIRELPEASYKIGPAKWAEAGLSERPSHKDYVGVFDAQGAHAGNFANKADAESAIAHFAKARKAEGIEVTAPNGEPSKYFKTRKEAEDFVNNQKVHYFDIPPAWKDQAIGKGFPLYMQGIPFPLTPVDYDPFKDLGKEKMRTVARGANDRNVLRDTDVQASRTYGPTFNQEDH